MDSESGRARSGWIRQCEIQMDQAEEVFVSSSNSTGGVLEGGRSSEYDEKPKRAKIEPKRVKLMRKPKKAQIIFHNVGGTRVIVEPTSVNARGSTRTWS